MNAHDDNTKQLFLDALAASGVAADARRVAGIKSSASIKKWRTEDPMFDEAYCEAMESAADALEVEARRRAMGYTQVKFDKEGKPYDVLAHSDTLMLALLKAKKPHEFADRTKTELSGPEGAPLENNDTQAAARLMAILEDAKRRRDTDLDPLLG